MSVPKLYLNIVIFLLFIALASLAGFTYEQYQQKKQLEQQVEQLTTSQVVFMISDEHAEAFSQWLKAKPEMIEQWIANSDNSKKQSNGSKSNQQSDVVKPFKQDSDIKQYSLPNGGILITTREQ